MDIYLLYNIYEQVWTGNERCGARVKGEKENEWNILVYRGRVGC